MTRLALRFSLLAVLAVSCGQTHRAVTQPPGSAVRPPATSEATAQEAADEWLRIVDAGDFARAWGASAAKVRTAIDLPKFTMAMKSSRPLHVRSRLARSAAYTTKLADNPDGEYVLVTFETVFDPNERAIETVMMTKEDGQWRMLGSHIEPASTEASPSSLSPPPAALGLGLDPFYRKYLDAHGIAIVSSARVDDRALLAAGEIVERMLKKRPDARAQIVRSRVYVVVLATTEQMLDLPEYADQEGMPVDKPGPTLNERSRGLGATLARPITSSGEENLLCTFWSDPSHRGQNVFIHELGHTIASIGLGDDAAFQRDLRAAFVTATAKGLWGGTYSATSFQEYWAVGVEAWFGSNLHAVADDDRPVHSRAQLAAYDAELHALLARVFDNDDWHYDCARPVSPTTDAPLADGPSPPVQSIAPPRTNCPARMASVPGGTFALGGPVAVQPFCMDLTEVSVAQYGGCVRSGRCSAVDATVNVSGARISDADRARLSAACNGSRRDRQNHPMNCVDWNQADAYCHAQGKRLPTGEEWAWAARGGNAATTYPWGNDSPASQLCWSGAKKSESTCPVATFPTGDAPGGIHDLAGNVWEWTSTGFPDLRLMKGGGWNAADERRIRAAVRWGDQSEPTTRIHNTGFRCAL